MKEEAINFLDYADSQVEISGVPQFDIHSDISSLLLIDRCLITFCIKVFEEPLFETFKVLFKNIF